MKLLKLKIQNFKRINDFTLSADGKSLNILGANATGKSSIYNAFLWLLFGKDSEGRSDFEIKPSDKEGNPIHFLQTLVEGEFIIDGNQVKLCRTYAEKWSKKRGEENQTMSGHETNYFIDDVPKKKIQYNQFIGVHIDEEMFKVITNPLYFNDEKQLPWKKRREILMSLVQEINDHELIGQSDKFKEIVLRQNSIDETNKYISNQLRKVHDDINETEIRMKEVSASLDENLKVDDLKKEKDDCVLELGDIGNRMSNMSELARNASEHQTKIAVLKSKIDSRVIELKRKANDKQELIELNGKKKLAETELKYANDNLKAKETQLLLVQEDIKTMLDSLSKKNDEYKVPYREPDENDFICPTCHQSLPEGDIESQKNELKSAWLRSKNQLKDECIAIANQGKEKRVQEEKLKADISESNQKISKLENDLQELQVKISQLESQEEVEPDLFADKEYVSMINELKVLQAKVLPSFDEQTKSLQAEKAIANNKLSDVMTRIATYNAQQKSKERLDELKAKMKTLVQEQTDLEKQKLRIDDFISYKCSVIENQLNEKFAGSTTNETIKWRLFETLVNGEIKDTCICLIDGVPFSGANDAAKINVGLAIINVLCKIYSKTAPIFVDNAESVNELIEVNSQVIKLIVSKDNPLKVEVNENKEELKEAI